MACSTCKTKQNINLKQSLGNNPTERLTELIDGSENRDALFKGRLGKFFYFLILLICALTPIINIVAIYIFYIAIYGNISKKDKNVKKPKNTDETE